MVSDSAALKQLLKQIDSLWLEEVRCSITAEFIGEVKSLCSDLEKNSDVEKVPLGANRGQ